tara:strand:- start:7535 stop:10693 length:3159 start_codon:yes stop_codon:yes gene_type:complete
MPRLDTIEQKQAFVSKLGTRLPTPYIHKVSIISNATNSFNDETSDGIEIELSVYVPAILYLKPTELINKIADIKIIVAFIIGNREIDTILYDNSTTPFRYLYKVLGSDLETISDDMLFVPMKDHEDPDEIIVDSISDLDEGTVFNLYQNYTQITISDLDKGTIDFYDEETDSYYYKFTGTVTIPLTSGIYLSSDYSEFSEFFDNAYQNTDTNISYKDLDVIAFATSLDWENISRDTKDKYLGKPAILKKLLSDLSFESIFKEGALIEGPQEEYANQNKIIFSGAPMKSLSGKYRETSNVVRDTFALTINNLIPSGSTEEEQEIADNLSYLISTEKNSIDFLLKLQQFRTTFPNKESSFYENFRSNFVAISREVDNMAELTAQLVRNTKIFDSRTSLDIDWEAPDREPGVTDGSEASSKRIYGLDGSDESIIGMTRYAYSQTKQAGQTGEFTWESEDTICNYGYFAFDYERCLRNDTAIAQIFDIDKLQAWFGNSLVCSCLLLDNTVIDRYLQGNTSSDTSDSTYSKQEVVDLIDGHADYHQVKITTQYSYGPDENPDDGPLNPSADDWEGLSIDSIVIDPTLDASTLPQIELDYGMSGTSDRSYCALRNVVFPGLGGSYADQRLMVFEFQDYYKNGYGDGKLTTSDDVMSKEYYVMGVTLQDVSINVMNQITASYKVAMDYLQEYYDMANEACSYDEAAGAFNSTFVDNINDYYSDNSQNAPWLRCPMIFNLHRDIVLDIFGGDSTLLIEDSNLISDLINPTNGNIEQIENFMIAAQAFYDKFYNPGEGDGTSAGGIAALIASAETDVTAGQIELTYKNNFTYLPDIYYAGETEEDYLENMATTPAYGFMGIPGAYGNWYEARSTAGDAGHPKNAEFEDADTLSQDAIKSEIQGLRQAGPLYNMWLPWMDGIMGSTDVGTIAWAKELFTILMTPAGKTWEEYSNSLMYYVYGNNGYDGVSFKNMWWFGLIDEDGKGTSFETFWEAYASGTGISNGQTAVFESTTEVSPMNAAFNVASLLWPMANQESPTYGEKSLVTDMWGFLGIDEDTYGS